MKAWATTQTDDVERRWPLRVYECPKFTAARLVLNQNVAQMENLERLQSRQHLSTQRILSAAGNPELRSKACEYDARQYWNWKPGDGGTA